MFRYNRLEIEEICERVKNIRKSIFLDIESYKTNISNLMSEISSLTSRQEWRIDSIPYLNPKTGIDEMVSYNVRDFMAEAANKAQAAMLEAQQAALGGKIASLEATTGELDGKLSEFRNAITLSENAINKTTSELNNGTSLISKISNAFDAINNKTVTTWAKDIISKHINNVKIEKSDIIEDTLSDTSSTFLKSELQTVANIVEKFTSKYRGSNLGSSIFGETIENSSGGFTEQSTLSFTEETGAVVTENLILTSLKMVGEDTNIYANVMANSTSGELSGVQSFEEAQDLAKTLYANYLDKFDYDDETKQNMLNKYNNAIDDVVVLSDEEFNKRTGSTGQDGIVAIYNGPADNIYIRESYATSSGTLIHEAGGHGVGSMIPEELTSYCYYDEGQQAWVPYEGDPETATVNLVYRYRVDEDGTNYSGINEAATEYFTRKISGKKNEDCAYNASVDALESINKSMEHWGINGDKLLLDTYTGEDKNLYKNVFNEIMGSDSEYKGLSGLMYISNTNSGTLLGNVAGIFLDGVAGYVEVKGTIYEVKQDIGEVWDNLETKVSNLWDTGEEFVGNVWDTAKEYGSNAIESIGNAVNAGEEFVGNVWDAVLEYGSNKIDLAGDTWNAVLEYGANIEEALGDISVSGKEWAINTWDAVMDNVDTGLEMLGNAWETTKEFGGNAAESIGNAWDAGVDAVKEFGSNAAESIGNAWDACWGWITG